MRMSTTLPEGTQEAWVPRSARSAYGSMGPGEGRDQRHRWVSESGHGRLSPGSENPICRNRVLCASHSVPITSCTCGCRLTTWSLSGCNVAEMFMFCLFLVLFCFFTLSLAHFNNFRHILFCFVSLPLALPILIFFAISCSVFATLSLAQLRACAVKSQCS